MLSKREVKCPHFFLGPRFIHHQNSPHIHRETHFFQFVNLLSVIVVILFQLSRQPWSHPTSSEWPQITHFHRQTQTRSSHWSGFVLVTTFNFSISSIPPLSSLSSTSTIFLLVTSHGTRPTLLSHPLFTYSPPDTRRRTGKMTDRTQRTGFRKTGGHPCLDSSHLTLSVW